MISKHLQRILKIGFFMAIGYTVDAMDIALYSDIYQSSFVLEMNTPTMQNKQPIQGFDDAIKEKYKGKKYSYILEPTPPKPQSRFSRWLEKLFEPSESKPITGSRSNLRFFQLLVRVLIGIFLVWSVYLILNKVLMENHRSTNKAKINTTVDVNQILQETSAFDYAAHIEIQVNRKAYREAIRLYHLWCLDVLNSQKIIQYHSDKTNLDYLYDIKEKKLFEAFRYLTYIYDNIWFGAHPLDDYTFSQAKIPYDLFIQKLYTS